MTQTQQQQDDIQVSGYTPPDHFEQIVGMSPSPGLASGTPELQQVFDAWSDQIEEVQSLSHLQVEEALRHSHRTIQQAQRTIRRLNNVLQMTIQQKEAYRYAALTAQQKVRELSQ